VEFDPAVVAPQAILDQVAKTGFSVPAQTLDLAIGGMTCALLRHPGRKGAECAARRRRARHLATEKARVSYRPGLIDAAGVLAAVARAGYTARPITETGRTEEKARKAGRIPPRIAGIRDFRAAHPAAAAQMLPMLAGAHHVDWMPPWLQWLLATPVEFLGGKRFYTGG